MASCCSSNSAIEDAGPRRKLFVVFLLCLMGIGFMMILESPTSLNDVFLKEMKIKLAQFELHYHLLFWSNGMCWVSGFIIDRYLDLRLATVIFITSSLIGNTLYAIGAVTRVYVTMLIGWLITGLGVEASFICICCYIFRWFPKKFTNTIFAIVKSVTMIGRCLILKMSVVLMSQLSKTLKRSSAFSITISLEMCLIVIPLICAVILASMSKQKQYKEGTSHQQQNTIKIVHIIKFPLSYWILSISINIFFSSCYIFLRLNVLSSKYGLSHTHMEVLVNGFIIGSCFMGPITGLIVDWKGRNLMFITLAFIGGTIAHFSFAFTIMDPFYPMILLAFSFSLVIGSYWPLYTLILKKNEITAALALDSSIFMICFAIGHAVTPKLSGYSKNAPEFYLLATMIFAIIGSCILWGLDCNENVFNQPNTKREKRNRRTFNRNNEKSETKKKFLLKTPSQKVITPEKKREVVRPRKLELDSTYLRLKRYEAESKMHKHQRIKRHSNRMIDRRKSKSYEELYILSSQV